MHKKSINYTSAVKRAFSILICCFLLSSAAAQSVSLDLFLYGEAIRRQQLLGITDSLISFNIRPLHLDALDSNNYTLSGSKSILATKGGIARIDLLPLYHYNEFNTHHPYGWNNGSLMRSRGLQSLFSAGLYAKAGPLSVQFRPELIFVENKYYDSIPNNIYSQYISYPHYVADLPLRFGNKGSFKILPGQSSVKLNIAGISLGASTENIWWGPGKRNSLLMSNNTRGFEHLTIHTNRPAKIGIGALEGQMIIGRLEGSQTFDGGVDWRFDKRNDWRYLSGFTFSFSPKWTPGLFLGISRTIQQYFEDTKNFKNYYPVMVTFFRRDEKIADDLLNRDQYASVYLRWVWKKARAEWYVEFGRNDASWHFRDFILTPEHSRAFTMGFVKLSPLKGKNEYLQFHTEITQLQQSVNYLVRDAGMWYGHYPVRHGYTHRGEVLGAGIGPGSNVQFLEVSWIRDMNKVGFQLERLVHNNDFYYRAFSSSSLQQPWVDLSAGVNSNWRFGQLLLSGKMQFIRSLNYWWQGEQTPVFNHYKGKDVSNLHMTFGVIYGFK